MKKKKIEKLSATLDRLLSGRGMGSRLREYRIFSRWQSIVGSVIARHARPQSLRGKKLTLTVDNSAWMQQLTLLKPEIIEKVNAGLGPGSIDSITLRIGEVPAGPLHPAASDRDVMLKLDERESALLDAYTRDIKDEEIRQSLRRVIEKDLLRKKTKR